jgi:hypothetical protein
MRQEHIDTRAPFLPDTIYGEVVRKIPSVLYLRHRDTEERRTWSPSTVGAITFHPARKTCQGKRDHEVEP